MTLSPFPKIHRYKNYVHNFKGDKVKTAFQSKIKLHGTNARIEITNGVINTYSKNCLLENDNYGFKAWAKSLNFKNVNTHIVIYGEWAGPGVQKGVALSGLKEKTFFVFAVQLLSDEILLCPQLIDSTLKDFIEPDSRIKVLPVYSKLDTTILNWQNIVISQVAEIDNCDPYILAEYGIRGVGEGLVFYPDTPVFKGSIEKLANSSWKAKGQSHVTLDKPKDLLKAQEFAQSFVNEPLARQAVGETKAEFGNMSHIVDYIKWINKYILVKKAGELQERGLQWKDVSNPVAKKAVKLFQSLS